MRQQQQLIRIASYVFLIVSSFIMVYPMVFMVLGVFTTPDRFFESIFLPIPNTLNLHLFVSALRSGVWDSYIFTLYRVGFYIVVTLVVGLIGGYIFSKLKFPGKNQAFLFLLSGMVMPGILMLVPTYLMVAWWPLIGGNNWLGQGGHGFIEDWRVLFILGWVPVFAIFILKQSMDALPTEYEDAAKMDGAGMFTIIFRVYGPLLKPPLVALVILIFIGYWNEFLWPSLTVAGHPDWWPIGLRMQNVIIGNFSPYGVIDYPAIFVKTFLGTWPPALVYFLLQRYFVQGLVSSGLKAKFVSAPWLTGQAGFSLAGLHSLPFYGANMLTLDQVNAVVNEPVIAEYWERGYWTSPKLFDDDQIARLRAAHERMWAGDHDYAIPPQYGVTGIDPASPKVRQQCNAFWLSAEIRRAVTAPVIGAIGARLMGVDTARLWHDQAIYKPGTAGQEITNVGNIGWHQDYGYWKASSTTNMCTAWVALQDTDLSNGGMRTIVGSHKWGLIEGSDTFGHKDFESLSAQFAGQGAGEWLDEPCILKAGEASFHHCLAFHGSGPNRSSQPRLSVVAHMMPGDTVYRAGRQWHPNLVFLGPNAQDGQPFTGDYFPQLWPVA